MKKIKGITLILIIVISLGSNLFARPNTIDCNCGCGEMFCIIVTPCGSVTCPWKMGNDIK